MTKAEGTKKKSAAMIHKLIDDVPLWAAAAIQRGPRTAAMLKSKTSQKPIARRNCIFGSDTAESLTRLSPAQESIRLEAGNCAVRDHSRLSAQATYRRTPRGLRGGRSPDRRVSVRGVYRGLQRSTFS